MSDMEQGELARRLRAVEVAGTEAVIRRALAAEEAPRRRRRWMAPAVVAAVLAALVAAIPIAQATSSPIAGWILQMAGIPTGKTSSMGSAGGASATVGGHTMTVLGAYGDVFHTVVVVHSDAGREVVGAGTLRDGTTLVNDMGLSGSASGDTALMFRGLAPGLHHLTLTIGLLGKQPWVLHFDLRVDAVQAPRANPPSGSLHGVPVTIQHAGGAPGVVMTEFETRGATMDELFEEPSEAQAAAGAKTGPDPLKIRLFGPSGKELPLRTGEGGVAPSQTGGKGGDFGDVLWEETWPWAGKGTYRLVLTYKGDTFQSTFTIT